MVKCELCGMVLSRINNTHLYKHHKMTPREYLEMFPHANGNYVLPECAHPECNKVVSTKNNTFCSSACSMSYRMNRKYLNSQSGSNNHTYVGFSENTGKWAKKAARERDNHTCQRCGLYSKSRNMHVHHITPIRCFEDPQDAHTLDNLITLCIKCHKQAEWDTLKEATDRARKLDELLKNDPNHIPFNEIKLTLIKEDNK